jgi:hypothetical protein
MDVILSFCLTAHCGCLLDVLLEAGFKNAKNFDHEGEGTP